VSVIDDRTNGVVAQIPVGTRPLGLAYNEHDDVFYVANFGSSVTVINAATKLPVANIGLGANPVGVAVGRNGNVFVTAGNAVKVITPLRG
jgi:YVTN family beta-propeller protein